MFACITNTSSNFDTCNCFLPRNLNPIYMYNSSKLLINWGLIKVYNIQDKYLCSGATSTCKESLLPDISRPTFYAKR